MSYLPTELGGRQLAFSQTRLRSEQRPPPPCSVHAPRPLPSRPFPPSRPERSPFLRRSLALPADPPTFPRPDSSLTPPSACGQGLLRLLISQHAPHHTPRAWTGALRGGWEERPGTCVIHMCTGTGTRWGAGVSHPLSPQRAHGTPVHGPEGRVGGRRRAAGPQPG